ncbi:MAG: protein translocase subunit SecD [Solirubrobacterales bacterium]|nr:protein translocase subunit SecD [Solirubrobacterales bacterium]MBV9534493.1 protein translocase subunit SecD [Solirubrobacterales bacterium]
MSDRRRYGFILLLVAGLIAASAVIISQRKTILGLDLRGGVELVYQGQPTPQTPHVTQDALQRAVDIMNARVNQLGVTEPQIQTSGGNQITVALPDVTDTARAIQEVGTTARLEFYDWERNVLLPDGKTVASALAGLPPGYQSNQSLLSSDQRLAVAISQGGGAPGQGSVPLYDAVKLASKQPVHASADNARKGSQYYLFGNPGSAACSAGERSEGIAASAPTGFHCLLNGPDTSLTNLYSGLPAGVSEALAKSQGQVLKVPQGTVVLQATSPSFSLRQSPIWRPTAQFYVLNDNVALFGNDITNPQQSTDTSGAPDVSFGFSSRGQTKFQQVTNEIAQRGVQVSGLGPRLNQHFAVALDTNLVTVPQIDFKLYPNGIIGGNGADITGGFTATTAQQLAQVLRLGALPINLKLISEQQVSATLGKQALHQGLIAGLAGLAIVVLFLLFYYRVLGMIATAGLFVYALYFYALIKLIPVTLTLPGIAGLILTIGVAADANIVIFERVKEEIRAGRSIRQGIITGYRKGLTAIIDANVVTIMTAFILFVLATSDVKGFALTLGIGTFVSLFTAVMATQAILMTMGRSRLIARPSALGAGKRRFGWRFDFMGASRYFFTMSGVILLVGALAVGGKGLNLGIDFTSGTRITTGLQHRATIAQVRSVMTSNHAINPQVQRVTNNRALGPYAFQISSKELRPGEVSAVKSDFQSKFGVRTWDSTSIGPTFGRTIADAAVIAIIASLLVISVYVALRFEWKFAVPVLIALAHDLLITSGVYALTGRQVTVDTVAALLTILGYSLYDTIIVFDRVRENIPRMPRAAFSQIVNRSMSEVLTRSLATTSCTLLPVIALLLFGGGGVLGDFAFALLIGIASGAYSSIFIASPVLTHWKEREAGYRTRRKRITAELGYVPAYATAGGDVEPTPKRPRRTGRLTAPEPDTVSAAEFEQMKRDLEIDEQEAALSPRQTSTLTKRLAHTAEPEAPGPAARRTRAGADGASRAARRKTATRSAPPAPEEIPPAATPEAEPPAPAPDIPENEGVAPAPKPRPKASSSRSRNRRHGRRR